MITHRWNRSLRHRFPIEDETLSKRARSRHATWWSGRSCARFSEEKLEFSIFSCTLQRGKAWRLLRHSNGGKSCSLLSNRTKIQLPGAQHRNLIHFEKRVRTRYPKIRQPRACQRCL